MAFREGVGRERRITTMARSLLASFLTLTVTHLAGCSTSDSAPDSAFGRPPSEGSQPAATEMPIIDLPGVTPGGPAPAVPPVAEGPCEVCSAVPTCTEPQTTRLTGRVVSPGRTDDDTGNQLGIPNALVYILRNNVAELPEIPVGLPDSGSACDRCEEQEAQLGEVLQGALTDATGRFELEDQIPVGVEFTLVVKAGKFRRGVRYTVPASSACQTVDLPTAAADNPTRLPRQMDDGLFVHLPKIAVSTGQIDAMECVFEKMGIAHQEFANPGADGSAAARIHLYRGGPASAPLGAYLDAETPISETLFDSVARLQHYDLLVADCEGPNWDQTFEERDSYGDNVREYVNRGGRLFASHLSFSWLADNGDTPYSAAAPVETGLGEAATWSTEPNSNPVTGTGIVAIGRPNASPRITNFAQWLESENVTTAPSNSFTVREPRSQATGLGDHSEEFIYCDDSDGDGDCRGSTARTQQFSFNTPYGAPAAAACGRVAYSGFHVAALEGQGDNRDGAFGDAVFPEHCGGNLTDQEKVLLYMLFDLGACIGEPEPPRNSPIR